MERLFHFMKQEIFFFARVRAHVYSSAPAYRQAGSRTIKIGLILMVFSVLLPKIVFALDPALETATQKISDSKLDNCLPAIELLGFSRDTEVVQPLVDALDSEKRPIVRRYIVNALGRLHAPEAREALIDALQDKDPEVRQSAVAALSIVGGPGSDDALVAHVDQETDVAVKAQLAAALGRSTHPGAMAKLDALAQDTNPQIQKIAADTIQAKNKLNMKSVGAKSIQNSGAK